MEDDKKKKRNKKKKNKQNNSSKTTENDAVLGASNGHEPVSGNQNGSMQNSDSDFDRQQHRLHNEAESSVAVELEKQQWQQREAVLEDRIKLLQSETVAYIRQKELLEETVKQLRDEHSLGVEKQAALVEKIEQLKMEKDSWIACQNDSKETLARMNIDMARLQMQVVELEDSRNSVMKENQQLMESISDLRLQIQNLEIAISSAKSGEELKNSECEELNSQIEAACALVDKLVIENAELVEKVNELYIKLDRLGGAPPRAGVAYKIPSIPSPEDSKKVPPLNQKMESTEAEPAVVSYPSEAESGEIVQIPLDDNEVEDLESQSIENNEEDAVPLTDAPLIGAPFRLISFVAKYVSGADLVNQDPLT